MSQGDPGRSLAQMATGGLRWAWRRGVVVALVGLAGGVAVSRLPAPADGATFWLGNSAVPFVVLPALGSVCARGRLSAGLRGALIGVCMILGFYHVVGLTLTTGRYLGVPPDATALTGAARMYFWFFDVLALGRADGGAPWLTIALACGFTIGYRSRLAGQRMPAFVGRVAGVLMVAEPLFNASGAATYLTGLHYRLSAGNLAIWGTEELLGIALIVITVMRNTVARARGAGMN